MRMNYIFFNLIKNIYKISKLPIKRYTWNIEMKVLELDCELSEFLSKYDKMKKKNEESSINLRSR